eukprot:COSAG01_NODE_3110_length_6571_cov_218.696539_10_plen_169_part_00
MTCGGPTGPAADGVNFATFRCSRMPCRRLASPLPPALDEAHVRTQHSVLQLHADRNGVLAGVAVVDTQVSARANRCQPRSASSHHRGHQPWPGRSGRMDDACDDQSRASCGGVTQRGQGRAGGCRQSVSQSVSQQSPLCDTQRAAPLTSAPGCAGCLCTCRAASRARA